MLCRVENPLEAPQLPQNTKPPLRVLHCPFWKKSILPFAWLWGFVNRWGNSDLERENSQGGEREEESWEEGNRVCLGEGCLDKDCLGEVWFGEISFEGSCFEGERLGVACCGARGYFGGGSCDMIFSYRGKKFLTCVIFWPPPRPKNAIPRWYTGRKWHIPMTSNRKRSRGRIKAYDMGQDEGPIVPLQWSTGRE